MLYFLIPIFISFSTVTYSKQNELNVISKKELCIKRGSGCRKCSSSQMKKHLAGSEYINKKSIEIISISPKNAVESRYIKNFLLKNLSPTEKCNRKLKLADKEFNSSSELKIVISKDGFLNTESIQSSFSRDHVHCLLICLDGRRIDLQKKIESGVITAKLDYRRYKNKNYVPRKKINSKKAKGLNCKALGISLKNPACTGS